MITEEKKVEELLNSMKLKAGPPTPLGEFLIWLHRQVANKLFARIRWRIGIAWKREKDLLVKEIFQSFRKESQPEPGVVKMIEPKHIDELCKQFLGGGK